MSKQRTESKDKCGACLKITGGGDSWIACEICEGWFHSKCVGIQEEQYKVMNEIKACHWYCQSCDMKMAKIIPTIVSLHDRMVVLEEHNSKLEADLKKVESDVSKISQRTAGELNSVREEMDKHLGALSEKIDSVGKQLDGHIEENNNSDVQTGRWKDVVEKHIDESLVAAVGNVQEVRKSIQETKEYAEEQRNKESRRNNIILYNVPESEETRAEDRNKGDISFCLQMFNNCMHLGISEEDLVNVIRLGRRGESARPLLIQLVGYNCKNLIMESLYKLRHAESKFKGVIVAHDMTKMEREECRRLVVESKCKAIEDTSGEYLYRVRGTPGQMRIVKIRVRS